MHPHPDALRERLLSVMDQKTHHSFRAFRSGAVGRRGVAMQYEQEWGVYMRDFPVMVARVLGMSPPFGARAHLAETLYEEQTGGLSGSAPHTELFLRMMAPLGLDLERLELAPLLPESLAFRAQLDGLTLRGPWLAAYAVLGIFLEGGVRDRAVLSRPWASQLPTAQALSRLVSSHPLVRHYGVPEAAMDAVRVHVRLDARRRHEAWSVALEHASPEDDARLESALREALGCWLAYRAAIARAWDGTT